MHRLLEVDRIKGADIISGGDQHFAGLNDQGSFRVSDHDRSSFRFGALHDIGLDEKPGFTGTGAADHQHILVCQAFFHWFSGRMQIECFLLVLGRGSEHFIANHLLDAIFKTCAALCAELQEDGICSVANAENQ